MNKKSIIATIFIVLILGGYYIYNNMFPVAEPIQYPTIEDIISIDVQLINILWYNQYIMYS